MSVVNLSIKFLTSKADLCSLLLVLRVFSLAWAWPASGGCTGGVAGAGGPSWKLVLEGLESFSSTLFMSLTVSPRLKYSSSTSLAVLTRSRLAPVILMHSSPTFTVYLYSSMDAPCDWSRRGHVTSTLASDWLLPHGPVR